MYVISAPDATPPTRRRRSRGSLSPKVILDAAEAVAAQGFDALSVRAVAGRLDAVPMALYNHFATKDDLGCWTASSDGSPPPGPRTTPSRTSAPSPARTAGC